MSQLERQENYSFGRGVRQIRISLQWSKHQRPIAFSVFRYDFKARLSEVLRSENYKLTDGFIKLESAAMVQKLSVDFTAADGTSAFAITVDGFGIHYTLSCFPL